MISITGKKWKEKIVNQNLVDKLKQDHNFSHILSKLIISRNFDKEEIFSIENNLEVKNVFCDESRILIPNAFSPNEDQKNDFYRIIDEDKIITKFKLEIFNRFGEKVYFSEDVNESWNGYFKGELLASQVFDYYLEIKCIGNKTLFEKGNITLIR